MLAFIMKQWELFREDVLVWSWGWYVYSEKKVKRFGVAFEKQKGKVVEFLLARRGTYQRPFLHASVSMLILAGAVSAPIVASSYQNDIPSNLDDFTPPSAVLTSLDLSEGSIQTQESEKPRDQIITYTIKQGDTLSSIATKYGVSIDTIRWANDTKSDSLTVGGQLKIPPVTGIVYKVRDGDTIQSVAKKYKTEAQKIANFPFNDFADLDTFALTVGQSLVVPDGVIAAAPAIIRPVPPIAAGGTGQFLWPASGTITQYPVWYHMALDIANRAVPGVAAADGGTIALVEYLRYGYGQHVMINHGNGLSTLYAHLSEIYVKPGDRVGRGQIIGRMGSTGRSTGTHLHFEVRKNGAIVNPLPFLK